MRAIAGFIGADVLRRPDGDEEAFVTLTRFASLDAIRAFAGDDYERPVSSRGRASCCPATTSSRSTSAPRRSRPR